MFGKRFVKIDRSFLVYDKKFLENATDFIHESFLDLDISRKRALKAELLAEETIVQLMKHAPGDAVLHVRIRRYWEDASMDLSMKGESFDPFASEGEASDEESGAEKAEEDAIRSILMRSYGENYKYQHKNRTNHVRIRTGQSEHSMMTMTIAALFLGLLFGLVAKFIFPASLAEAFSVYLLTPVKTMFMNSLKIVIAPVVFFSIVTCISQFKNVAELGRLGAKVMGMYMLTTVIAVLLGTGVFQLLHPGEWGFALTGGVEAAAVTVDTSVDTSLLHTIVNIVPSNFFVPFVESDTLQLIFLAVLCGIAVGMVGEYSGILKEFFEACNSLFLTITGILARVIPVAVFCSIALLVLQLGGNSLFFVLGAGATHIFAIFCMICIYGLLILILGRLNPLTFFRKNREGMLTSFMLSSSSAAMPTNLKICTEKLGISPKVCNFAIPLGATINMDGTCIYLCTMGLFLARAYGVNVPPSSLLSLAITVILLSLGAPGVPGVGLVCLGVVLTAMNVPIEAIGLVIGINPILDMCNTMSNTTGDVAASLIVAKNEKLLDEKVFRS